MQTFLPFPDFAESAVVLDRQRLGKQRVETLQIMKRLLSGDLQSGWGRHPAVQMWVGYELALYDYQYAITEEWMKRGYKDTCRDKTFALLPEGLRLAAAIGPTYDLPPWFGDDAFHRSHRSNLLRKDHDHYGRYFDDPDDLEYVWPSKEQE